MPYTNRLQQLGHNQEQHHPKATTIGEQGAAPFTTSSRSRSYAGQIQVRGLHVEAQARHFIVDSHVDGLLGLDADHQLVCVPVKLWPKLCSKDVARHMPELHPSTRTQRLTLAPSNHGHSTLTTVHAVNRLRGSRVPPTGLVQLQS